jgi:hypothetical protein
MITKRKTCEVCKRSYQRSPSEVGPAICSLCRHKPEAKKIHELAARVQQAALLGEKAFKDGRSHIPALDPDLQPLLKGNDCMPVLKAWADAWHKANLDAPVVVDGVDIVAEMRKQGPR